MLELLDMNVHRNHSTQNIWKLGEKEIGIICTTGLLVLILLHYYSGLSTVQYYFYIKYLQAYQKRLLLQLSEVVRERIYVLNQIHSQYIWRI